MNKHGLPLVSLAVILCASVRAQTVTGPTFITGFEFGALVEGRATGGSVQSTVVRSGSFAYRANPIYSNQYIEFMSRSSGGVLRRIFRSSRFYIRVAQLPLNGSVAVVKLGGASTFNPEVDLNSDGTLTLADSWYRSIARSQKALTPDGAWHRVEFDVGTGLRVYVDGQLWASGGGTSYPSADSIRLGAGETPTFINATADLYFDDVRVDGGSYATSGLPGDGRSLLLRTVADPVALNGWMGGGGSTASLWMPVNHVPAAGLPARSATNMSQIRNSSHGSNQDYAPQIQSYASAGIPLNAVVNAVMALCSDGQESAKGNAKSGAVWLVSNPSQPASGYTFDYGDGASVIGTFPSGWSTHFGAVAARPFVNLAASPVVAVRKAGGTDVHVDFVGLYVDYR